MCIRDSDVGSGSGWMYSVNDWYPNYGCSCYTVQPGDVICWVYTCDLGQDVGGGGTIAYLMSVYGMEVIDSGVAVLGMHAPWETTSKADIYEAVRCYEAFLKAEF